jgi:pyruvate dehydrogenase E2 component (dihydrolipoamide acetyltransferase)
VVSWDIKEGQEIEEGDILASIETDKATIDFENQDTGYIAKILNDTTGEKISVGSPLFILVQEEEEIAQFKDFTI